MTWSDSPCLGCSFFAYSWKLPAYSGSFLLTFDNLVFYLQLEFFLLTALAFSLTVELAYNGKVRLIRALRDCKQRSWAVSKKKKKSSNCKWKSFPPLFTATLPGTDLRRQKSPTWENLWFPATSVGFVSGSQFDPRPQPWGPKAH